MGKKIEKAIIKIRLEKSYHEVCRDHGLNDRHQFHSGAVEALAEALEILQEEAYRDRT